MFGTLRPHSCDLSTDLQKQHRRFYCGLCKTLGNEYSLLSRATLNFDAVFIALIGDALAHEAASPDSCRCPMMPIQHRETISPNSPAMRYAAAVQMLLADQWVADHMIEGKTFARLARPLLHKPVQHAHEILRELDIDLSALQGFEHQQAAQEVQGQTHPIQASKPTEEALSIVFQQLIHLPGTHPDLQTSQHKALLGQLGKAVGRVIYMTDALDDLRDDFLKHKFNPCLTSFAPQEDLQINATHTQDAIQLTQQALDDIKEILSKLPWQRHQALLHNILCSQFSRMFHAAKDRALAMLEEETQRQLLVWRQRHWLDRTTTTLFVMMAAWFAWFQHLVLAISQGPPGGKAKHTGYLLSPIGDPSSASQSPCSCGPCNSCFQPCFKECGRLTESCGQSCSCVSSCNKTCADCNKTCTSPCKQFEQFCQQNCCSCPKDCGKTCEPCEMCTKNCCPKEGGNIPCCEQGCKGCENCSKSGSDTTPLGC